MSAQSPSRPPGGPDAGDVNARDRRLIAMARENSEHARRDLYQAIGELFDCDTGELGHDEYRIMLDILRRLTRDVEMGVRAALAKRLSVRADAPRELLMMLIDDGAEVAHDILMHSPVLKDPDLIECVRQRAWRHQMAVAMRNGIGAELSQALVETGSPEVIVTLLDNHSAQISPETLATVVEDSRETEAYQAPLVRREDLPPRLAKRMLAWVSAALRQDIMRNFEIDAGTLDDGLSDAMHDFVTVRPLASEGEASVERMIDKIQNAGQLTPTFVFGALQRGNVLLFELALARLTGLEPVELRRMLYESGGKGLAILCRSLEIDKAAYAALFKVNPRARGGMVGSDEDTVAQLLDFYEELSPDAARLMLRRRRHADALESARQAIGPVET